EPLDLGWARRSLDDESGYVRDWARHNVALAKKAPAPIQSRVPFEIQTLAFGTSLVVVTLAAEASVEHGLRLKRELGPHFDNVLVLGYSNGIVGYLPVKRQIPEGGYEVIANNQYLKRTGPFAEDTEERIHSTIHAMLGLAAAK
ncbi:MAG: hypothetical protein KAI66_02890, partial [Lentisphaeria bacterium]|nr:hypothetical protein [Lentisphaeria bacterium]